MGDEPEKIDADYIRSIIHGIYSDRRRYAIAEEVGLQTGFSHRRLDMMVLDCYESNGFRIDGFEIKISKADLRKELEDPEKHVAFYDVLDYFWLACPANIIDVSIIPKKWGILAINQDGSYRKVRRPLALHDSANDRVVPRGFLASITRAIQSREPSRLELDEAYKRGAEEAKEGFKRQMSYQQREASKNHEKALKYDELMIKFHSWDEDVNKKLDRYEKLSGMGLEYLSRKLSSLAKTLTDTANKLDELEFLDKGQDSNDSK